MFVGRLFKNLTGQESLSELIPIFSRSQEFSDVQLRVNEKLTLNCLNRTKNGATIRYPMPGKIKTTDMKVNCLIQATFEPLPITEPSLLMDVNKIFRSAGRISSYLLAYVRTTKCGFALTLSVVLLGKCLACRMWNDSLYVTRQLLRIGPVLSTSLVMAGYTTFFEVEKANPRELEAVVNRRPPFGNQLIDAVLRLPRYTMNIAQEGALCETTAQLKITIQLLNYDLLSTLSTAGPNHTIYLLVGDSDNQVVCFEKLVDSMLIRSNGSWSRLLKVQRAREKENLEVNLISETLIGVDITSSFTPFYSSRPRSLSTTTSVQQKSKVTSYRQTELNFPSRKKARLSQDFSSVIVDKSDDSDITVHSHSDEFGDILKKQQSVLDVKAYPASALPSNRQCSAAR